MKTSSFFCISRLSFFCSAGDCITIKIHILNDCKGVKGNGQKEK